MPDNKFLNTEKIKEKISSEGETITYDLNDIVNYQKPDLNTKFKITFVIACRIFYNFKRTVEHDTIKKNLLYLELLTYHFNKKMIDDLELPNLNSIYNIKSICWSHSSKLEALQEKSIYFYPIDKGLANINIDSKVPNLQKINDTIDIISPTEINYLCNLSLKKLFYFISLLDEEKGKILVRKILSKNYDVISDNFKKFIGLTHHVQKPVRDSDYEYEYMDSVLEYMFKLGNILASYSGIENLFIMRNLSQTTLDYQIFKKTSKDLFYDTKSSKTLKSHKTLYIAGFSEEIFLDDKLKSDSNKEVNTLIIEGTLLIQNYTDTTIYPQIKKLVLGKGFDDIDIYIDIDDAFIDNIFDYIFTLFPNLMELIFKNDNISKNLGHKKFIPTLKKIKLENTSVIKDIKFKKLPNLESIEINNISNLSSLNLSNINLKNVIIKDIPTLKKISINKTSLDLLTICNCNDLNLHVSAVKKLILDNTTIKSLSKCNITNLELTNCDFNMDELKKFIPKSSIFSFRKKNQYTSVTLNFVKIGTGRASDTVKDKFIGIIKKFKNINLAYIYLGSLKYLVEFTRTDLETLQKNKVTIEKNLLANNLKSNPPGYITVF